VDLFAVLFCASTKGEAQAQAKLEGQKQAAAKPPRDVPAYRTRSQTRRAVQACAPVAARTRSKTCRCAR
jgi:hypothetical protein